MVAAAPPPTLAGFVTFIRNVMGITTANLPDNAAVIPMALSVSLSIVNPSLQSVAPGGSAPGVAPVSIYTLAVYNLGGSNIINYAQDPVDAPIVAGSQPPAAFFENLRQKWNINGFVSGVIQSAGDQGTSESMVVMDAARNFTLANLQQLKDPYGRQYLAFAQSYGSLWGIS